MTTHRSDKKIDINMLAILFIVYFIIYSGEIVNFNVSIDDEVLAFSQEKAFLDIGRWVSFIVRTTLFPQPIIPLLPYIMFGISIVFSFLCILRALSVELGRYELVIFFALFCSHPIWYTQLEFAANAIPISIAVASCSVGFYLYKTRLKEGGNISKSIINFMSICLFIAIGFGAYQTFALVFLSLAIGSVLLEFCRNKDSILRGVSDSLVAFFLTVAGVAVSLVVSKVFMIYFHISESQYGKDFFHITDLATDGVSVIGHTVYEVYFAYILAWSISPAAPFFFGGPIFIFLIALLSIQNAASRRALISSP